MYAVVTRRRMNRERAEETRERATSEFWPKLQQAPGFVSFSLIQGEDGVTIVVVLFESKARADAFQGEATTWSPALDELGHQIETQESGEVLQHITPRP